jgi:agmatine/peptidylarginine deiminase
MGLNTDIVFPAEWAEQDAIMLTWPNSGTDWAENLDEAEHTYISMATEILKHQKLLIVCNNIPHVRQFFPIGQQQNIRIYELPYNDTWARDHGPITTIGQGKFYINDFGFNGWGNKFDASLDNLITEGLFNQNAFRTEVRYNNLRDFILEGGSIESDGNGTILTTSACLLNPNRNPWFSKTDIELKLAEVLGTQRILWLNHGHLEGDDTDSHIDTLARFCNENTIAYVKCPNSSDTHFEDLALMEAQLKTFTRLNGGPYRLVPLPMVSPICNQEGERMGATYANFLIINKAVLVPVYGVPEDNLALEILSGVFPDREIVGINCLPLIKQNGSLHCITMQIPKGLLS